jgi:hypothetical protein
LGIGWHNSASRSFLTETEFRQILEINKLLVNADKFKHLNVDEVSEELLGVRGAAQIHKLKV